MSDSQVSKAMNSSGAREARGRTRGNWWPDVAENSGEFKRRGVEAKVSQEEWSWLADVGGVSYATRLPLRTVVRRGHLSFYAADCIVRRVVSAPQCLHHPEHRRRHVEMPRVLLLVDIREMETAVAVSADGLPEQLLREESVLVVTSIVLSLNFISVFLSCLVYAANSTKCRPPLCRRRSDIPLRQESPQSGNRPSSMS